MTKALTAAAIILLLAPSAVLAQEQHRAGDAALGALSGAVVLGPIGAVAGAFVGYSAGPAIARSWGIDRSGPARHRRQVAKERARAARAEVAGANGTRPAAARVERDARVATSASPATSTAPAAPAAAPLPSAATPPVQTLE